MRLICLNIWGGRVGQEALKKFLHAHRDTTDIFCFQEVWTQFTPDLEGVIAGGSPMTSSSYICNGCEFLSQQLPGFTEISHPCFKQHWGNASYSKGSVSVKAHQAHTIFDGALEENDVGRCARNLQNIVLCVNNKYFAVMNVHGLWNGKGKGDTSERLEQSRRIAVVVQASEYPVVLVGDFNLEPDTESLRIIEQAGLRNLIREYGITSTRTSHYPKPGKFADYAFVSEGIRVHNFTVLPDEVSDHAPLLIDFDLE